MCKLAVRNCLNSPFCFPTLDSIAHLDRNGVPSAAPLLGLGDYVLKTFKLDAGVKVWNTITFKLKPALQDSMRSSFRWKMKTSLFPLVI